MTKTFRFLFLAGCIAIASAPSWAKGSTPELATSITSATAESSCSARPLVEYTLGPQAEIDALYPAISSASLSESDRAMGVAASIQFYLQNSLNRDHITDNCGLKVVSAGKDGYRVSFHSAHPQAAQYGVQQSGWLERGKLALQGVQACQAGRESACWQPTGAGLTCVGPWQFYLPLGLPMVSQKMVMLLHYPPYTAMQQADYLNNATLNRWRRLLGSVGVPDSDWTLYTTTVDIFPIAAPGSGQSGCLTTDNAVRYFGTKGSGYVPAMLQSLVAPQGVAGRTQTLPVIAFGGEAIGFWNSSYPASPTAVLKAGTAALLPQEPNVLTPYMGANHPIAAVYQTCESKPGIVTMVGQDLATACFAKRLGDKPSADVLAVQSACQAAYLGATPSPADSAQICINAVIDKSPQFAPWPTHKARTWCTQHANRVCPLPTY